MKKMNKLLAFTMVLVMLVSTALVGCGNKGKGGNGDVDIYGENSAEARLVFEKRELEGDTNLEVFWFDTEPREDVVAAAALYKELYGGEISYYCSSWNDRATDLSLLNSAKELPDVLLGFTHYDFPKFTDMGLFAEISDDEFDFKNEYVDEASSANLTSRTDKKYGVAIKDDPEVIIYNKKYISQLGYETPWEMYQNGNWDWASFKELAKNLSYDSDKDGTTDHYGFNCWSMNSFFNANNAWPLTGSNASPQLNVNSKEIQEAYQLLYDMYNVDKSFTPKEGFRAFCDGEIAMYLERPLYIKHMIANGVPAEDIEIAPVPKGPSASDYMALGRPIVSAVGNSCEKKEAALAFIECYMSIQAEMSKTGPRESYGYTYSEQQKACMDEVRTFKMVDILPTGYGSVDGNLTSIMGEIKKGSTVSAAIELYKSKMESALQE